MRVEQDPHWPAAVAWLVRVVREVSNDAVRPHPVPGAEGLPPASVAAAAEFHGVPGFARLALGAPSPEVDRAVHAAQARHLRALANLELAQAALDAAGVDVLVVKGPALVATAYAGPHLRSYLDLDLLVRPADVGAAVAALERAGCSLVDRNWPLLTRQRVSELKLVGPRGGAVDLHWSLGGATGSAPAAEVLLARSVLVPSAAGPLRTLAPADLAVHVAVHAAASGGHRLVWSTDLRGALGWYRDRGAAPLSLERAAREWRSRPAVQLVQRRARRLLGSEAVGGTTGAPDPWAALAAMVDRVRAPELAGEGGAVGRLLARSCRADAAHSATAAVAKLVPGRRRAARGPLGVDVLHDPDDPRSGLHDAGGEAGRRAFLASLTTPGGPGSDRR